MLQEWIEANFELKSVVCPDDNTEKLMFKVQDSPERWAYVDWFISTFGTVSTINHQELSALVGDTGWQGIFDDWLERGILN